MRIARSIIWNTAINILSFSICLHLMRKIQCVLKCVLEYREIPLIVSPRRIARERKEPREFRSSSKNTANYRVCIFHTKMRGRSIYSRGICICPRIDRLSSSVSIYPFAYQSLLAHISKNELQDKTKENRKNVSCTRERKREKERRGRGGEVKDRVEWDIIFLIPGAQENRPDTKCMQRRVTSMYLS